MSEAKRREVPFIPGIPAGQREIPPIPGVPKESANESTLGKNIEFVRMWATGTFRDLGSRLGALSTAANDNWTEFSGRVQKGLSEFGAGMQEWGAKQKEALSETLDDLGKKTYEGLKFANEERKRLQQKGKEAYDTYAPVVKETASNARERVNTWTQEKKNALRYCAFADQYRYKHHEKKIVAEQAHIRQLDTKLQSAQSIRQTQENHLKNITKTMAGNPMLPRMQELLQNKLGVMLEKEEELKAERNTAQKALNTYTKRQAEVRGRFESRRDEQMKPVSEKVEKLTQQHDTLGQQFEMIKTQFDQAEEMMQSDPEIANDSEIQKLYKELKIQKQQLGDQVTRIGGKLRDYTAQRNDIASGYEKYDVKAFEMNQSTVKSETVRNGTDSSNESNTNNERTVRTKSFESSEETFIEQPRISGQLWRRGWNEYLQQAAPQSQIFKSTDWIRTNNTSEEIADSSDITCTEFLDQLYVFYKDDDHITVELLMGYAARLSRESNMNVINGTKWDK